jgi:uncharacterized protein (DUF4415 family)
MKSDATKKPFPASPEEWEALIAEAPGEDTPRDAEEERVFWENAVVVREGGPQAVRRALDETKRRRGQRGPQKAPTKVLMTIRLDADVIEHFKAQGPGWQTRINEALRKAMGES